MNTEQDEIERTIVTWPRVLAKTLKTLRAKHSIPKQLLIPIQLIVIYIYAR